MELAREVMERKLGIGRLGIGRELYHVEGTC